MFRKFIDYLVWSLAVISIIGVLWFIVEPIIWWNEMRLYLRLFLLMFALNTFATLRLYNSIVQNTRFSIKLREALLKFTTIANTLERAFKNLNNSVASMRSSIDSLRRSTDNATDKVDEVVQKFKK